VDSKNVRKKERGSMQETIKNTVQRVRERDRMLEGKGSAYKKSWKTKA
jgi:hypothetical protein